MSLDEMLCLEGVLPMACCDLRAELGTMVTASHACETARWGRMFFSPRQILVFDFFSGLGGLPRALEQAGLR